MTVTRQTIERDVTKLGLSSKDYPSLVAHLTEIEKHVGDVKRALLHKIHKQRKEKAEERRKLIQEREQE